MLSRLCLCAIVAAGSFATAQEATIGPAKSGPEQQALARLAGEYTTTTKFLAKPGDAPMESRGTAKLTSTVDGKILLEEYTGVFSGQTIHGLRLMTYNEAAKQYEATWTYSMASGLMSLVGTSTDDGKT